MAQTDPAIAKVLSLDYLHPRLPASPRINDIQWEPYIDSTGADALRVVVILDESVTDEQQSWEHIKPIERIIRDALLENGVALFPYIDYFKRSDMNMRGSGE